jgi:hypothetical protein
MQLADDRELRHRGVSLPISLTPRDDGRRTGMVCSPLWVVDGGQWTSLVDEYCP